MTTYNMYIVLLIIMCGLLFYFGAHLCFGLIPRKMKGSIYESSKKLIGQAYFLIAITIFGFFALDKESIPAIYSISVNITCYYWVAAMFALAFHSLLANKLHRQLPLYNVRIISLFIFPIPLWLTVFLGSEYSIYTSQIIGATFLFAIIGIDVFTAFHLYQKSKKQENKHAEEYQIDTDWILTSLNLVVVAGATSAVLAFAAYYPKWILVVYLIFVLGVFVYIFEKFHHFEVIFFETLMETNENHMNLVTAIDEKRITIPITIRKSIEANIFKWLKNKEYCNKNTTIQETASHLGTNRSYLSIYINTTYNCSFRNWISKLRIEEAKRLLEEDNGMSITSISDKVGFLSISSFTHTFTNTEGCSPKKWLDRKPNNSTDGLIDELMGEGNS